MGKWEEKMSNLTWISHKMITKVLTILEIPTLLELMRELLPLNNLPVVFPVGLRATDNKVIIHSVCSAYFYHSFPWFFRWSLSRVWQLVASVLASCGLGQHFNAEGWNEAISGVDAEKCIDLAFSSYPVGPDEIIGCRSVEHNEVLYVQILDCNFLIIDSNKK